MDSDCSGIEKCCFDGCGLKCSNQFKRKNYSAVTPQNQHTNLESNKNRRWNAFQNNKELIKIETLAECPQQTDTLFEHNCENECTQESDCRGMRKCCRIGCSSLCLYPKKTTRRFLF